MTDVNQSSRVGSAISVDIEVIQKEVGEVVNERFDSLGKNDLLEMKVLEAETNQAVSRYFDDLEDTLLLDEIEKLEESVEETIKRYIQDITLAKTFPAKCNKLKADILLALNNSCSTITRDVQFQQVIERLQNEITEAIEKNCESCKRYLSYETHSDLKKKIAECVQNYFEDNDDVKEGFEMVQSNVTDTIIGFMRDIEEKHLKIGIGKLEKDLLEAINTYFEDLK